MQNNDLGEASHHIFFFTGITKGLNIIDFYNKISQFKYEDKLIGNSN